MKTMLALLLLFCLNEYTSTEHNLDHKPVTPDSFISTAEYVAFLNSHTKHPHYWIEHRVELEGKLGATPEDLQLRNDYAVTLVHLGEVKNGLERLRRLEQDHPGQYMTATNLGTALELAGQDEEALKWIREGIQRNPDAHYGTEWIHVKILEAKLALAKDPRWLEKHTVLGYDFGDAGRPRLPAELDGAQPQLPELRRVIFGLEYQLMERLEFVKPPDPVMADVLFTLGNLQAFMSSADRGAAVVKLAVDFHPVQAELVEKRLDFLNGSSKPAP